MLNMSFMGKYLLIKIRNPHPAYANTALWHYVHVLTFYLHKIGVQDVVNMPNQRKKT